MINFLIIILLCFISYTIGKKRGERHITDLANIEIERLKVEMSVLGTKLESELKRYYNGGGRLWKTSLNWVAIQKQMP